MLTSVVCTAAGFGHTCALDEQGRMEGRQQFQSQMSASLQNTGHLHCFGDNVYGQCSVPKELGKCKAIAAGFRHTCAISTGGSLVCFGDNGLLPHSEGTFCYTLLAGLPVLCTGCGQCDVPEDLGAVRLTKGTVLSMKP